MNEITGALEITGLDKLLRDIKGASVIAYKYLRPALDDSLNILWGVVAKYPPDSEANHPGRITATGRPVGYYERGRGWWDPVTGIIQGKTGKTRGIIQAGKELQATGVAGYKLRNGGESEQLGRSWTKEIHQEKDNLSGTLGTTVSYADEVQGSHQRKIHAQRGWITIDEALNQVEERIFSRFDTATLKLSRDFQEGKWTK